MKMAPETPATDLQQYAMLRTILDSLETGALRYYLGAKSQPEMEANYKFLKTQLTPIIEKIWAKPKEDTCPDGYHNCDGYCVSYPCVG
jgi:hypothetical protein